MITLPVWLAALLVFLVLVGVYLVWRLGNIQKSLWLESLSRLERQFLDLERRLTEERLPRLEADLRRASEELRNLSHILAGRRSGESGERVLEEVLSSLPQDWVQRNVPLGQGRVEFVFKLPGGFLVPIDSKFVTPGEESLSEAELRGRLKTRITEMTKYLTDPRTLGFGLAVVPEGVYALSRTLTASLANQSIVVVSYTHLLPILTSLYLMAKHLGLSEGPGEFRQDLLLAREALSRALQALAKQQTALSQMTNRREEVWRELSHLERLLERMTNNERF